jgi:hypothetical protein
VRQLRLPAFLEQQERFKLRFNCEHCTYFHVELERCMHGYPNAEHREGRHRVEDIGRERDAEHEPGAALVFCKEFELV